MVAFARDNYRAVARQFEFRICRTAWTCMDANTLLVSAERKAASAAYNYQLALLADEEGDRERCCSNERWTKNDDQP